MPCTPATPTLVGAHRRLKTAVRKTVKWGGAVVTVILVVVWIGSGWIYAAWISPNGHFVEIRGGRMCFRILSGRGPNGVEKFGDFKLVPQAQQFYWWADISPYWSSPEAGRKLYFVPLWFPAFLSLLATAAAWRADARHIRRAREGACPACGYDRAGLAAGAVCPECGSAAAA